MSAFPYAGQWLGMVTHFRYSRRVAETSPGQSPDDGPIDVQLVHSRDGRSWRRCEDRSPVIANGPPPYDQGCVLGVSNLPVVVGDAIWLYYTAITTPHGGAMPTKEITIARAAWRRDGFVSLDAGDREAVVETVPIRLTGNQVYINANAAGGQLTLELLDAAGRPVDGYTSSDCVPIRDSGVGQLVTWRGRQGLPAGTTPVCLRFYFRNCSLFSYTIPPNTL